MNDHEHRAVCCGNDGQSAVGLTAHDFAELDRIALKLICADGRFSAPARQMGRLRGERIVIERCAKPLGFDEAISILVTNCGCDCALQSHFIERSPDAALLQITGCSAVLGWKIPCVNRAVCSFDAGLFEGFLATAIGETIRVEETACLGLGDSSCEFKITLHSAQVRSSEQEGDGYANC